MSGPQMVCGSWRIQFGKSFFSKSIMFLIYAWRRKTQSSRCTLYCDNVNWSRTTLQIINAFLLLSYPGIPGQVKVTKIARLRPAALAIDSTALHSLYFIHYIAFITFHTLHSIYSVTLHTYHYIHYIWSFTLDMLHS